MSRPQILGIFYCEFDNIAGPKILYQSPEGFVTSEQFDGISDYMITGTQLSGKLITVNAYGLKFTGYPVCIANEKYHRNALLFNVGFVFAESTDADPYHNVIRKFVTVLQRMELESAFLFDVNQKMRLADILPLVQEGLNSRGEATILVDKANLLSLKLFWAPEIDNVRVLDHQVPVLLQDSALLLSLDCDLALQQVIPHIDGVKFTKKISLDAEVDIEIVKRCLRVLLYYSCIMLIDIFQHSNVYISTGKVNEFSRRRDLQYQCREFISTSSYSSPPPMENLAQLYSSFRPGLTVQNIMNKYIQYMLDYRRLVTFGVVHGLIRRLYGYPICTSNASNQKSGGHARHATPPIAKVSTFASLLDPSYSDSIKKEGTDSSHLSPLLMSRMHKRMDGNCTQDELCCEFMMGSEELLQIARMDKSKVIIIYK